jgi:adhesin transport system outer membrane protein
LLGEANAAALRATKAYLDVLRHQQLLRLAKQNLGVHHRIRDQVKLRSDSGVGRTADLNQIEARLALAKNSVAAAKANLEDAKTAFKRVGGEDPGKLSKPHGLSKDLPNCSSRDAVITALETHPTLKSAYADVDEATEQYESTSGTYYPQVDLELGASRNFDLDGSDGEDSDASAMLRMRWNLYNGGRDSARRRETAHLINQAKDVRNRTHREVEESVRLSCTALRTTRRQLPILRRQVAANAKTRDAYVQQFNLNERTLLDVLNTENDLLQSREDLANTSYDNLYAQFRVANDVGILTELMRVKVYDQEQPAELHKAVRIRDYSNTKYPNDEYMEGVKEHKMNVFPFDDD